MGRRIRPHLPGAIFHLTARILRREHLLDPALRTVALSIIASAIPGSEARLLATAIMSNHLHLVVQQGRRTLDALMQPLLRRLALAVQKAHGITGPVFWRPYGSTPCLNPSHARNAVVYTHLNPVRAGLCDHPDGYAWTSHDLFLGRTGRSTRLGDVLDPSLSLRLFASAPIRSSIGLRQDYLEFLQRRIDEDRGPLQATVGQGPLPGQSGAWGSGFWADWYDPLFTVPAGAEGALPVQQARPDMADVARAVLAAEAPGLSVEMIRGRRGGRAHSRLRHLIIRRLHLAGYRNVQIASFIGLSDSAVSLVIVGERHEIER